MTPQREINVLMRIARTQFSRAINSCLAECDESVGRVKLRENAQSLDKADSPFATDELSAPLDQRATPGGEVNDR